MNAAVSEVDVLALPTLIAPPPLLLGDYSRFPLGQLTAPFNLAGVPALSIKLS